MGKLVFNFKSIKLTNTAQAIVDKDNAKYAEERHNRHISIAITPFNIDYEYKEKQRIYDIEGEEHRDIIQILKCETFNRITSQTIKDIRNLPCYEGKLLTYIACNLNWDSNIIIIDANNCPEVSTGARYVKEAINELVKLKYLAKTNIVNVYIINHNRMFLGNMKKFIVNYKETHKNEELIIDNKGRVVIKKEKNRRGVGNV